MRSGRALAIINNAADGRTGMGETGGTRRRIMKHLAKSVLAITVIAVCAVAVQAQSQTLLKADIPFNFSIGDRELASGSYTVRGITDKVQVWQDSNHGQTTMVMTIPKESRDFVAPKLVFHRYGDQYVLAEVWANSGSEVLKGKAAQKLAKAGQPTIVAVLLRPAK
jgi:hypothetical protein